MIWRISALLVLTLTYRVDADCTNIDNEDKIDCVQHQSWTPESCLAKGCCHQEVPGFPACYYPFGNKHEARCVMSVGERHDCGNADTTEIDCINKGCCWLMTPGAPYCYIAKDVPTDTTSDTTPSGTDTTLPDNPPQCAAISNEDKIDCAPNDPKWTPKGCLEKGCCHVEVPGFPACFYTHGIHHDPQCQMSSSDKKDCGDASTTALDCEDKGCCWQISPGSPYCFHKSGSVITDNPTGATGTGQTVTDNPVTAGTLPPNPTGCAKVKDDDKVDCASLTPQSCVANGCCWDEVPGYPACFYNGDHKPDGQCQVAVGSRKDCGDSTTTADECKAKGCCWEINPGSPSCFNKG